jgi:hypothetical protein
MNGYESPYKTQDPPTAPVEPVPSTFDLDHHFDFGAFTPHPYAPQHPEYTRSDTQTLGNSTLRTHQHTNQRTHKRTHTTHDAKDHTHFPRSLCDCDCDCHRDRNRPESQTLVPLPRLRRRHRRRNPLPPPSSTTRPHRHKASHRPQDARSSTRIEHRLPPARRSPVSVRQTPACARNRFGTSSLSLESFPSPRLPFAHGLCLGWQRGFWPLAFRRQWPMT